MFQEQRLGLHRIDVLAADLQHVLVAAEEAERTAGQPHRRIAGAEPAILGEGGRGLGRLPVVFLHHRPATDLQLARHARSQHVAAGVIDDTQLVAEPRPAGRLAAMHVVIVERRQGDAEPRLGHAEAGQVSERRQRPHAAAHDRCCAQHAGREDPRAQAREIARPRLLRLGEALHVRLEAVDDRHALALDQIETLLGIEATGHDLPRAGDQRHPRSLRQAEGVEERQVVQDRVVRRNGHPQGAFLDIADQLVRPHHALGKPGRTRRVHDEGRRGGVDRAGAGGQMIGGDEPGRAGERGPVDGSRPG